MKKRSIFSFLMTAIAVSLSAQNPIVRDQFTADPTARVFGDKIYVYPSHDVLATEKRGRLGWFCMEDYHVFSSENLTDWKDHGVIVTQNKVPWVRPDSYSMWAPDCIERNGKYYFYFPSAPRDTVKYGRGFGIGVAIADSPTGPFVPEENPIAKVRGIDPSVMIAKDGQAYIYWSAGNIYGAKLKENMVELDSDVKILGDLPKKGLKEGPFVFERNGMYYLTFPHVENTIERLEYAMSDNPLGPFKMAGVIMDESPTGCWTNHQSIVQFKGQWLLFYHHNDLSPAFDKARSIRADSLFFNPDGTIQKVIPTLRGVGLTDANSEIQIDRFSQISTENTSIAFLDTTNKFMGWKTIFSGQNSWIRYNSVSFTKKPKYLIIKYLSDKNTQVSVEVFNGKNKTVISKSLPASGDWNVVKIEAKGKLSGKNDIIVKSNSDSKFEVDWIKFE
ncbi:MAG: family 43 glycosylhydrolase [Bacteroidetes bacterium]|nr:family 43 glycosylhydrolase [Bacteroidota bacterium]